MASVAEFAVIYDKKPASVARALYFSWICRYFVPSHVTSDNGTEFETEFVHLLARLGIEHVCTTAFPLPQMVLLSALLALSSLCC
jgi:hypothetical protein